MGNHLFSSAAIRRDGSQMYSPNPFFGIRTVLFLIGLLALSRSAGAQASASGGVTDTNSAPASVVPPATNQPPAKAVAISPTSVPTTSQPRPDIIRDEIKQITSPDFDVEAARKRAEAGDAKSQFQLGFWYEVYPGIKNGSTEAAKWFTRAAAQGNLDAELNLGIAYAKGDGVERDSAEAATWYRKAADQGDAWAEVLLGDCYSHGEGVGKDSTEASVWYR
jgi:hypothetical protein